MGLFGGSTYGVAIYGAVPALSWSGAGAVASRHPGLPARPPHDLTIYDRAGNSPVSVPVGDVQCSWAVTSVGNLSAYVPSNALFAAGLTTLLGRWVSYDTGTAGVWGGVVSDESWAPGEVEIACEDFKVLLRKRRTERDFRTVAAQAGGIVQRLISDAATDDLLGITQVYADEDGDAVDFQYRGASVEDVIGQLVSTTNMEWDIDADRVFRFQVHLGSDKTGSVLLSEGVEVVDFSLKRSLFTVTNDLLAVAGDERHTKALAFAVEDAASIDAYGRIQDERSYKGMLSKSTLIPQAQADLARLKNPAMTLEATLVDAGDPPAFQRFRHGDTIRVDLGSANRRLAVRVMARSLDASSGTMKISGSAADLEADRPVGGLY